MKQRAAVGVVEAGYRLEPDDQIWIDQLMEVAAPVLDQGLGVFAWLYRKRADGHLDFTSPTERGLVTELPPLLKGLLAEGPKDVIAKAFPPTPFFGASSELVGTETFREDPSAKRLLWDVGVRDAWGCVAPCAPDRGLLLGASRDRVGPPPPRWKAHWVRVAIHLSTALRVRRTLLDASANLLDDADAVLDPAGHVHHAAGGAKPTRAREALRDAALRMDRARTRDRDNGLDLWQALIDGRWTLLDHFDSDGRRFLVARRAEPWFRRPLRLTQRQRQVLAYAAAGQPNQLIAYALGVNESTVASALGEALSKLGLRSRADLARYATLVHSQEDAKPARANRK